MNRSCPHLGLLDDGDKSLTFPSLSSGCHCCRPVAVPNLRHQVEYCLSEDYCQCPVYLRQPSPDPLPGHLRAHQNHANQFGRSLAHPFIFSIIGIMVLITLGWFLGVPGLSMLWTSPTAVTTLTVSLSRTSPSAVAISVIPSLTSTADHTSDLFVTNSPIPVTSHTLTDIPTSSRISTSAASPSKRHLETPLGTEYKFLIHKVSGGENFNLYADKYDTSVEAIVTVTII
jgi:hypothetical protein